MKREVIASADACPWRDQHTPSPSGYLAWHTWAARMAQAHRQVRCKKCQRYAVWLVRGTNKRVTEPLDFPQTCLSCRPTKAGAVAVGAGQGAGE